MILVMVKSLLLEKYDLLSLRSIGSGAAPLPSDVADALEKGLAVAFIKVMKGFFKNPTATQNTIDVDGWMHTGDIGYYDENELIYVVDRLKELIKYKGLQVPPAELKAILVSHPKIADAAVIRVSDVEAGEVTKVYVVPKDKSAN